MATITPEKPSKPTAVRTGGAPKIHTKVESASEYKCPAGFAKPTDNNYETRHGDEGDDYWTPRKEILKRRPNRGWQDDTWNSGQDDAEDSKGNGRHISWAHEETNTWPISGVVNLGMLNLANKHGY